jgi:hypothetical protein
MAPSAQCLLQNVDLHTGLMSHEGFTTTNTAGISAHLSVFQIACDVRDAACELRSEGSWMGGLFFVDEMHVEPVARQPVVKRTSEGLQPVRAYLS